MTDNKRLMQLTLQITEQLLETENLEEALSGCLEILVKLLKSEAGAIWFIDSDNEHLIPMFHTGPVDVSGISIEYGSGVESHVIRTGQSVIIGKTSEDPLFEGSVFDGSGFSTRTMICVPLRHISQDDEEDTKVIGCIQVINKKDSAPYDEDELKLCERMAALAALTIDEKGLDIGLGEKKEILISLRNVIKEYQNPSGVSRVLKGINLDVYKGELLVVLGESGCGKSTMVNIIGGMDNLSDGTLLVEGQDYSHPSDKQLTMYRRHYIGFIFQSFDLMPNLTALENIRFIAEICEDPMTAEDALSMVGLADKGDNYPSMLSGGQQQRVAIARALVKNPKLILADEPTAALDYETSVEVLSAIEKAVKDNQTTVIMITHNPEIGKMADRVVKLRNGKVFSIRKNLHPLSARELEW